jgi:hypothetical protein
MSKLSVRAFVAALIVFPLCVSGAISRAADESLAGLATVCEAAKAEFRPLTPADLAPIQADLLAAIARLDARLTAAGATGGSWRIYLRWDALQEELHRQATPKRDVLLDIYQRLSAGEEGLNLVWFVEVQRALRQYLRVSEGIDNANLQTVYAQNLDRLAAALKAYAEKPTTDSAQAISDSLRGLNADRQSPKLVQSVTQLFRKPNLLVDIDESIIEAAFSEQIDENDTIQDCILGTSIQGTTHTVGKTDADLVSSDRFAVFDTYLKATAYSNTVGRNGPVCIYSTGTTQICGVKRIWIDENGLFSCPARSNADTQTCINDIRSIKGRKFIERIAWKKAGKQLPKAEAEASRHAECRVNERIDARAAESLDEANANFQKKIRQPLIDHKLLPEELKFATDENAMHVRVLNAGTSLIAALAPPPEAEKADFTLRIHESMVNNFVLDALGGMTIHQEQAEKAIIDTFGELPEKMKTDPNEASWGIIFAKKQPVVVTFADDGFKVTLHGAGYYKGAEAHPAMDVTAAYKIEKTADGVKAVRQGELQIFPPNFDQATGKLPVQVEATRHLLEKRFGKVFEPEIVPKPIILKGKLEKAGKFEPTQIVSRDGWLVLGYKRVPQETK